LLCVSTCCFTECCACLLLQELLKQLEAAAMAQRLGIPAAAGLDVAPDKLAAWQQQQASLCDAAAGINQQESQLGVKLTYYADLDEAGRVLKEIEEAHAAKTAGGSGHDAASISQ
jgi:hypothetical protein